MNKLRIILPAALVAGLALGVTLSSSEPNELRLHTVTDAAPAPVEPVEPVVSEETTTTTLAPTTTSTTSDTKKVLANHEVRITKLETSTTTTTAAPVTSSSSTEAAPVAEEPTPAPTPSTTSTTTPHIRPRPEPTPTTTTSRPVDLSIFVSGGPRRWDVKVYTQTPRPNAVAKVWIESGSYSEERILRTDANGQLRYSFDSLEDFDYLTRITIDGVTEEASR